MKVKEKIATRFKLLLFLVVSFGSARAQLYRDLEVVGPTEVNSGQEYWYDINYDMATAVEWWVTGGEIIEIEGVSQNEYGIYEFGQKEWTVVSDDKKYAKTMNYYGSIVGIGLGITGTSLTNYFSVLKNLFGDNSPTAGTVVQLPNSTFTIPVNGLNINTGGLANDFCIGVCTGYTAASISNKLRPKKVKVRWLHGGSTASIRAKGYDLAWQGAGGNKSTTQEIYVCNHPYYTLPSIQNTGLWKNCTEGVGVWVNSIPGQDYVWSSNGARISSQWSSGANVEYFTKTGPVTISYTASGRCVGTNSQRSITIDVQDINPGPILNNTTGNDVAVEGVKLNCNGDVELRMPYFHYNATYRWSYFNELTQREVHLASGTGLNSYTGGNFENAIVPQQGKVRISGVCGTREIPFTIPIQQAPALPQNVAACAEQATITAFLPANKRIYSWWVAAGSASIVNQNASQAVVRPNFYDPSFPTQTIKVCASAECATQPICTDVKFFSFVDDGTRSGQLSDLQRPVTSQLAYAPGQKIYFTSTDGDIHYYEFLSGIQKWSPVKTGWVNNANTNPNHLSPLAYSYSESAVFYWKGDVLVRRNASEAVEIRGIITEPIDLALINTSIDANNRGILFALLSDGKLYKLDRGASIAQEIATVSPISIAAAEPHGVFYFRNNHLMRRDFNNTETTVLLNANPMATSNLEVRGNYAFYTTAAGHVRRVAIAAGAVETVSSNPLNTNGLFTVGNSVDEVYYVMKNTDSYTFFYTASKTNGTWSVKRTTVEALDNVRGSVIYTDPHIYYVSAGNRGSDAQQGVWNTFFVPGCLDTPNPYGLREAALTETTADVQNNLSVYPNPANDRVQLRVNNGVSVLDVQVLDMRGAVLHTYSGNLTHLDISELTAGMYLLRISLSDASVQLHSLMKN